MARFKPDLARQPVQAAGQRRKADAWLGQREDGVFRRNDEVAGQRDLESTAHRHAVDGGDDRLVAVEAHRQPAKAARIPAALAARRLPFQVVAGAERPIACRR